MQNKLSQCRRQKQKRNNKRIKKKKEFTRDQPFPPYKEALFLSQRSTPKRNEVAILSVMKRKGKKTMKSQNHINKNTGGDIRKNNRTTN